METKYEMSSFKYPDLHERQNSAASAKKAMFEKFRAASQDPRPKSAARSGIAIHEARLVRQAEREAAKKQREAELAAQAAREAELALQAQREAEEADRSPRGRRGRTGTGQAGRAEGRPGRPIRRAQGCKEGAAPRLLTPDTGIDHVRLPTLRHQRACRKAARA